MVPAAAPCGPGTSIALVEVMEISAEAPGAPTPGAPACPPAWAGWGGVWRLAARVLAGLACALAPPVCALDPQTPFADYLLERWTAEDGLPQITVLTLAQDRRGYLWVGTQNGIARFDGRRFHSFNRASTGLDLTMPTASLADAEGAVWFGTPRGLLRQQDDRFEAVDVGGRPLGVHALALWQGQLQAATSEGLYLPQSEGAPRRLPGEPLFALAAVSAGPALGLWAGGESAVFRLDAGVQRAYPLPEPDARALALAVWRDRIAVGTRRGVWLLDPDSGRFERILTELAVVPVSALFADRHQNLWAGSVERLLRLRPDGSSEAVADADFMPRPWLHVIFEDRSGDLWMGSQRESLLRISDSALRVFSRRHGLHDNLLWSVLDDGEGGLWVGSNGGLARWSPQAGFERVQAGDALPDPGVYSLHRDRAGVLWLGTRGGLARLREDRIESLPAFAPLAATQVTSFADDEDALWIGSLEGLWRWQHGRLVRHGPGAGAPEARVRSLLKRTDGSLLIGTEGGLRELRGERFSAPAWAAPLEGSFISAVREIRPGILLLTTLDRGIAVLRPGGLRVFDTGEGLPSANAWTGRALGEHVYLSTNDGAYRLPLQRLLQAEPGAGLQAEIVVRAVNRARGDQRMGCCNGGGHARIAELEGALFFPTTNGLIRLDPERIAPASAAPGLAIEAAETAAGRAPFPSQIELAQPPRDLTLQFAGIDLRHATEAQFRYRLVDYQSSWKAAVDQRAVYTGLPPGDYQFELQARLPGRDWTPAPATLPVRVLPAWHERRSVRVLAVLVLLAAVVGGWRYSLLQARQRRLELEAAVAARTAALDRANERLRAANAALLEESRTDVLTGIGNRRALMPMLADCEQCALLLLDLDHFKDLNDRHGHAVGDQVLVQTTALLRRELPAEATLARWGGEEFLVLWPGLELNAALAAAEQLRGSIACADFGAPGGAGLRVTCSIGVALHPPAPGPCDWQLALELADRALYRAKAGGRDCVQAAQLRLLPGELLPQIGDGAALEALQGQGRLRFLQPGADAAE
jgi:diguanylate cyclase (GGDEF)-like protein